MENRKGSGIFLGVIGVATLVVAIIGATFAYFSANAASAEDAIGATGATLKLGYSEDNTGLKHNLIPAEDYIAHFGATDATHIADKGRCMDDVGNEICGYYIFNIGNPSFTTQQNLYGNIKISSNEFTNLYFEILDEQGNVVVEPKNFSEAVDGIIELSELEQSLLPSRLDSAETVGFDELDPTTYTKICTYGETLDDGSTCTQTNVRTYTLILWIHETGENQTEFDSGKVFAAGINFTSANDETGVTGVISAAIDPSETQTENETGA